MWCRWYPEPVSYTHLDADMVMFLYRDSYYNKDTEMKNLAEVIVAKQRNGPIGTINLLWMPEYTTFKNFKPGPPM